MPTQDEKTIADHDFVQRWDAELCSQCGNAHRRDEREEAQAEIERLRAQANRDAAVQTEDVARIEKLEGAIRGLVAAAENGIGKGDKQGAVEWRDVLGFIAREGRRALEK